MTKTETHTVETAYGPAEIETYDCDSCGNTVAYENTVEFTIGDTEGRACEHCKETGPVSFPKRVVEWALPYDHKSKEKFGLLFHVVLAPLVVPLATFGGFTQDGRKFDEGFATAVVVFLVWVGIPALLWVVL